MPGRKFEIRYLPAALDDLHSIVAWIGHDNPEAASIFVDDLENRIGQLKNHPLLGRIARHPRLRKHGYRVLILGSYLVFYTLYAETVQIRRVVHGSRNLDDLIS